jgi:hypothetical protein
MPRLCGRRNALVMMTNSQMWLFKGKKDLVAIRKIINSQIHCKEPAPHGADAHGQGPEGCIQF